MDILTGIAYILVLSPFVIVAFFAGLTIYNDSKDD